MVYAGGDFSCMYSCILDPLIPLCVCFSPLSFDTDATRRRCDELHKSCQLKAYSAPRGCTTTPMSAANTTYHKFTKRSRVDADDRAT